MLLCLIFIFAISETLALGAIALFASSVSDPQGLIDSKYMKIFEDWMGFQSSFLPHDLILWMSIIVVVLIVFKNAIKGMTMYWISRFSAQVESYFGRLILEGFLYLPYDWHLQQNSADLVYAVERRKYLGREFLTPCLKGCRDLVMIAVMLLSLLVVQPLVSVFVLIVLGGAAFFIYAIVRKQIDRVATGCRTYEENMNRESTKAVHGIKDIKVARRERTFADNFSRNAEPFARYFGWLEFYNHSSVLILEAVGFLLLCGTICLMLFFMSLSVGEITGTIALLAVTAWRILPGLTRLVQSLSRIRRALPYVEQELSYIEYIYSKEGETALGMNSDSDRNHKFFKNIMRLDGVSFAYSGDRGFALQDVTLEVAKGSSLGIIGCSGSGKSTLVDVLIGLLQPQSGKIWIDSVALGPTNVTHWIDLIGYVPQVPYIYDGTIAENIAFGYDQDEIDEELVAECCKLAAADFIDDFSHGIYTEIGERGIRLSGGQRQRISIARALYKKPEVIVFDEATSSLDSVTEASIQKTINNFLGFKTLIVISHRLDSVRGCDQIAWIDKGRVVMKGEPADVIVQYELKKS